MDVVVPSICLSSLTGAILFYAGGRLSGRPAPPAVPAPEGPAIEAERAARERAEQEASGALKATREAVAALAEERSRSTALREELGVQRSRSAALEQEVSAERARSLALRQELSAERARSSAVREELSAERRPRAAAEAKAAEAEALRADNARLAGVVAALEKQRAAAPDLAEVQRRTVTATLALRSAEQRVDEAARREAENTELRRRVEALSAAAAEAEALRRRVRDLEAEVFAARKAAPAGGREPARTLQSAGPRPGEELAAELETGLTAGLRELARREAGCRSAVLSDLRGLLVAAHGEAGYRLELAAAAALTTTIADRLRELIPIGEPAALSLVDDNGTQLRTRWLHWEGEDLLLSTLGRASGPVADAPAAALRDRLATLLGVAAPPVKPGSAPEPPVGPSAG